MRQRGHSYKTVKATGGKRADLGGLYCRSAMEANFARVLEALKARAVIISWEYEPQVYGFTEFGYKRGPWAYTPDFRVTWNPRDLAPLRSWAETVPGERPVPKKIAPCWRFDNPEEVFEVKGRETSSDRSKMRRMRKHYPKVRLTMIGPTEYRAMAKFWKPLINGWEGR